MESEARLLGIQAEKKALRDLAEQGKITAGASERAREVLERTEAILASGVRLRIMFSAMALLSKLKPFVRYSFYKRGRRHELRARYNQLQAIKDIKTQTSKAAINALSSRVNNENRDVYYSVIAHYTEVIERLSLDGRASRGSAHFEQERRSLQYKAIQTGRDKIQALYESGEISRPDSVKLRHFMSQLEATVFEEEKISIS